MKFLPQLDQMDCGPTCVAMVSSHYGKELNLKNLREKTFLTREGVSLSSIKYAAESVGFETLPAQLTTEKLIELATGKTPEVPLPCILHWNQTHFVVLHKISKPFKFLPFGEVRWGIADPGHGFISLSKEKFEHSWLSEEGKGVALFLEPTEKFYQIESEKKEKTSWKYLLNYLVAYKKQLSLMFLLLFLGSGLNLLFPFLTQNLIDKGIKNKDLDYITIILIAQLSLFFGSITIDIFRNWITLFVGTKLSIQIISDFLKKLLTLPIKFFDSKMNGDIQQRIQDNERIEYFITSQSILTFFSLVTFSVFFGVLWYYDFKILLIYLVFTVFAVYWSWFWLKKRKMIDYFKFQQQAQNQSTIWEIIGGVVEMKLNQLEEFKRKEWENIQHKLFKINLRLLKIDQLQSSGFEFINQLKNILVTFLVAYLVVQNKMTLGEMLSVSYIIGQMNAPVNQLVNFFRSLQDAKLSLERLSEVQTHAEEEQPNQIPLIPKGKMIQPNNLQESVKSVGIVFKNISFQYEGPNSPFVLKNVDLIIPDGKVTAIVGTSGSGKTTLLKLLLKFYDFQNGEITYNSTNLEQISAKSLRENSGIVMQDGYIFSDTIERNIACGDEIIDYKKIEQSLHIAHLQDFINQLPLGLKTKIGSAGNGISGGQKQRILIARAVYKNPHYLFFDEATSALDAENEKIIHDNLQEFFENKTVLIIAHRLSTVKNANQIVVLKKGEIVEVGNHQELVSKKGEYFNLVKNQLELGG
jgi:ATP-binding cassette subfamily B protein